MGAHDTAESGEGSTVVLLLTGRTRIDWLTKEIRQLPPDVRLVVGTAIRLPEQLDWLWKHQWIDFRQWDVSRLARQKLPQIPEAVTRVRFPFAVRVIHHLMCSFIGLLIVAVGLANPEGQESAGFEIVPALGVWVGLVWLSRRLLRRNIPEAKSFRWLCTLTMAGSAVVIWDAIRVAMRDGTWLLVLPVALFLVAAFAALIRIRPQLAFWFPSADALPLKNVETLGAGRNWQTLLWSSIHAGVWYLLLAAWRP